MNYRPKHVWIPIKASHSGKPGVISQLKLGQGGGGGGSWGCGVNTPELKSLLVRLVSGLVILSSYLYFTTLTYTIN